jgi:hypothetical protein
MLVPSLMLSWVFVISWMWLARLHLVDGANIVAANTALQLG